MHACTPLVAAEAGPFSLLSLTQNSCDFPLAWHKGDVNTRPGEHARCLSAQLALAVGYLFLPGGLPGGPFPLPEEPNPPSLF
jgi:hypothetical protein